MTHWFTYPNIDPVAIHLGAIKIHWYGLSYLVGFIVVFLWLNRREGRRRLGLTTEEIQDFLVYALLGVLVGGRVFFVIADIVTKHDASDYITHPINIIAVWNGGMGFFGGLIGVMLAILMFMRRHRPLKFNVLADEVVMLLPVGIALTRLVNFINDELPGDICDPDRPWCIKFPNFYGYRYPQQLFEAILDILVLPVLFIVYRRRPPDGVVAWTWFTCYGITRTLAEIWREPDLSLGPFTAAQLISIPMIVIGLCLVYVAARGGVHTDATPRNSAPAPT
ncbi:MAG: prolipoprotein diacylglyceryl transferase [Candidatus Eremiobacteraeota bacterium]|nr:prolipoprotein diacylglyceryl transferase [Candidatus Eremiobacteraeota bacterium]